MANLAGIRRIAGVTLLVLLILGPSAIIFAPVGASNLAIGRTVVATPSVEPSHSLELARSSLPLAASGDSTQAVYNSSQNYFMIWSPGSSCDTKCADTDVTESAPFTIKPSASCSGKDAWWCYWSIQDNAYANFYCGSLQGYPNFIRYQAVAVIGTATTTPPYNNSFSITYDSNQCMSAHFTSVSVLNGTDLNSNTSFEIWYTTNTSGIPTSASLAVYTQDGTYTYTIPFATMPVSSSITGWDTVVTCGAASCGTTFLTGYGQITYSQNNIEATAATGGNAVEETSNCFYDNAVNSSDSTSATQDFYCHLPPSLTTVTCTPSSILVGQTSTCSATVASIGVFNTPTGNVSFSEVLAAGLGSISFSPTSCILIGATCSVQVSGPFAGSGTVIATYGGDSSNQGGFGGISFTVSGPPSIISSVSITLTNDQSTSTPTPFQQMITFNPSLYSSSEASDLGNIRLCADSVCNTPLDAWLESCSSTCGTSATSATVWVKLDDSIQPNGGTLTIYMNFLPISADFDGLYWGEAPTLSPSYGQYDNGASVFPTLYQDFAGSSCPSNWTCAGAIINNGVQLSAGSSAVTTSTFGDNSTQILDFHATSLVQSISDNGPSFAGYTNAPPASTNAQNPQNSVGFLGGPFGNNIYAGAVTVGGSPTKSSVELPTTGGIGTVYYPSSSSASFSVNYGQSTTVTVATPGSTLPAGFSDEQGGAKFAGTQGYQWIRIRAYPPNGVMPTISIGSPSPVPEFPAILVPLVMLLSLSIAAILSKKSVKRLR